MYRRFSVNLIFCFAIISVFFAKAQYPNYSKDYFLFPIKPGQKNYLSGSMGELRPNHFHGGLDIKTDQKTGLPVYACADGYISRIVISIKGYGNTLYIKHPNGLTTVYAHLEWFKGDISKYIKKIIYEQQCNEIDLNLMPSVLPVKKGDTIAYSGNSGSSGGPHLHWEIRDEEEKLMNPLFFNFPEIEDKLPPYVNKFGLRTLSAESRVEGEFGFLEFTPGKNEGFYECKFPVHAYGLLGLELVAYDQMNGTGSRCGISKLELRVDGKLTFVHDIQKIDFDENPLMNLHLDYHIYKSKGNYFQRCYITDGNNLNTYKTDRSKGKIMITDTATHAVSVKIFDTYRNFTVISFKIKGTPKQKPNKQTIVPKWQKKEKFYAFLNTSEFDNILKIDVSAKDSSEAKIFIKNQAKILPLAYKKNQIFTYLYDLRLGLPDSVIVGSQKKILNYFATIYPANETTINHPTVDLSFPQNTLHDTTFLQIEQSDSKIGIHHEFAPTIGFYTGSIKTNGLIENKDKTAVYQFAGRKGLKHNGGEWIGNAIRFKTKYFGDFGLYTDTIPPKLAFHKKVGQTLYFKTSDYPSGIVQWYGYLNGKFIFLHFDPKYHVIFTDLPNDILEISGNLLIGVVDGVGNKTEKMFSF